MKVAAAMLRQWYSENPARLLQAALLQAERLTEMARQLEALRTQNASLHQQREVKTNRRAKLEEAPQPAHRAEPRRAAPCRVEPQKRAVAPKRPGRKRGHRPFQTSFADVTGHRRGRCAPRSTSPCCGCRSQQGQRAFHAQNLCRFSRLFRPAA